MFVIQRVLETEGKLTLLDQNRVIRPNPWFRLFATANTVGLGDHQRALSRHPAINQGQMDRWNIVVTLNYLPAAVEAQIRARQIGRNDSPRAEDRRRHGPRRGPHAARLRNGDISTVMSRAR